jgi:hypothetical protein
MNAEMKNQFEEHHNSLMSLKQETIQQFEEVNVTIQQV